MYSYFSVGFCVARSDKQGNARASKCGTSNWYRLPHFSFVNLLSEGSQKVQSQNYEKDLLSYHDPNIGDGGVLSE